MARGRQPTVVFIAGLGRSGSTLIDRALGSPPRCTSLGEFERLWERGLVENASCGCGESFDACPFWSDVGNEAFGGWDQIDGIEMLRLQRSVDRMRYLPLLWLPMVAPRFRRRLDRYCRVVSRLYRAVAAVTGADVIIDSSKGVSTAWLMHRVPGIDLRVLHLTRDSRAIAYSWSKVVQKPGGDAMMDRYAPSVVGVRYLLYNPLLHLMALGGITSRFLRYEDFVADPPGTTKAVLAFAGLPDPDLSFISGRDLDLGVHHSIGGNPMRVRRGPIEVRLDDAWRSSLASRDKRIVTMLTAPLLVAYRYLVRRGTAR